MALKRTYCMWAILLGWYLGVPSILAQPPDPLALLERIKARHQLVRDFQADVAIDVDVDFLRLPVKTAQVFYQQPDRWRFKAAGFLMLPRQGVQFSVAPYLEEPFSSFYVTTTMIDQKLVDVIKIVPLAPDADLLLATLWIDRARTLLRRVEAHTRSAGGYQIDFVYGDAPFGLPIQTTISFEINRTQLPLKFLGQFEIDPTKIGDKAKGIITLTYTDVRVNEGIDEDVFREPAPNPSD